MMFLKVKKIRFREKVEVSQIQKLLYELYTFFIYGKEKGYNEVGREQRDRSWMIDR